MRRFWIMLASAGAISALAGAASAAPRVRLKVVPLPIPGFPHTGYMLGAGAALRAEYAIEGQEYGGYPPPLVGVAFYLPRGAGVHPEGFPTCPARVIVEEREPLDCPPGSAAGPVGHADGVVSFGDTRVREETTVQAFYAPGGGLSFFTSGHSPVLLEIPSTATFSNLDGSAPGGPELIAQVPLVATVPGAPDASVEQITVTVGTALRRRGRTVYYGTVPRSCPAGGFPVRSQLTFAGLGGLAPQTVAAEFTAPCPRR